MAVPALSAAHTICKLRDWSVSNLELQKILYIAHMIHLGETDGHPLINEKFEAWDYGPVSPEVYHYAKGFGNNPIPKVFHWIKSVVPGGKEFDLLKWSSEKTRDMKAAKLVSITHWKKGAWARCYKPDSLGIEIPNNLILEEYCERQTRQDA